MDRHKSTFKDSIKPLKSPTIKDAKDTPSIFADLDDSFDFNQRSDTVHSSELSNTKHSEQIIQSSPYQAFE